MAKKKQHPNNERRTFRIGSGVACAVKPPAEGEKLPSFEGIAYTGAPMMPQGWGPIPLIIDLEGVRVPSQHRPALHAHDHQQIVGHTERVEVDEEGIHVGGKLSGQEEHRRKVTEPAGNGFQWQMSIGADPISIEYLDAGKEATVNGREIVGPMEISRVTELNEVSFVALGADGETSVSVTAARKKGARAMFYRNMLKAAKANGNVRAAKYSESEIEKMTEEEAKAALAKCMEKADARAADDDDDDDPDEPSDTEAADDDEDEDDEEEKPKAKAKRGGRSARSTRGRRPVTAAARHDDVDSLAKRFRKTIAAEEAHALKIKATATRYNVETVEVTGADGKPQRVSIVAHALENDWSAEKVELECLRSSRASAAAGTGPLVYTTNKPEVNAAVLEAAVLQAARHQFRLDDDSFYSEPTPDGAGRWRRVPEHMQRETQRDLKARYTDQVQQAAHTAFRGTITPKQLLVAAFRANGYYHDLDLSGENGIRSMLARWDEFERGMMRDGRSITAEGASNISISNVLANVLNKFALQGYLFVESAWRQIAQIVPVNDFKPLKTINLLGDVMYKQIGSTGELQNAALADQAFANQANPYGRILTIPWTHIVNDDLGMLTGVPLKIGQGAGLALNDHFWTLWKNMAAGSVNGDDGAAFWRTTTGTTDNLKYNPNKQSGGTTTLTSAGLTAAKKLFDNQIDPNGNPLGFDASTPTLLFGPSNWRAATELLKFNQLVYGGASASLQPNGNVWAGMMNPVMSRYIENANYVNSTTAWWILFNPASLPVIQVAFLQGQDTPAVLQAGPDYQFDRLGVSIRGTMHFGATQQNFRGGVYSVGA